MIVNAMHLRAVPRPTSLIDALIIGCKHWTNALDHVAHGIVVEKLETLGTGDIMLKWVTLLLC